MPAAQRRQALGRLSKRRACRDAAKHPATAGNDCADSGSASGHSTRGSCARRSSGHSICPRYGGSSNTANRACTSGLARTVEAVDNRAILQVGFHGVLQRRAARNSGRAAVPATQCRAAFSNLRAGIGRRSTSQTGSVGGSGHSRAYGPDSRAAKRNQEHLQPRLPVQLPRCDAGRAGRLSLPAAQCRQAVAGLPDVARGDRTRRGCNHRSCGGRNGCSGRPTSGPGAARDPRKNDEPIVAMPRRPYRTEANLRIARPMP
jgi:hypothetical protein